MMSQQPEFEYPEQEKRVINHDPREQRGSPGPSYQPPASIDEQQMGRQKIYPARSRKPRRWLWALALVAAIPALLAGQQYLLAGQNHPATSPSHSIPGQSNSRSDDQGDPNQKHMPPGLSEVLPQQSFSVQGTPGLTIKDPAGTVNIHRGNSDIVVIHPTLRCAQACTMKNVSLKAKTNGTNNPDITVQADVPDHDSLDLDITVPATSNIEATNGTGDLIINGVSGQMDLTAEAGTLTFENGTMYEKSAFKNKAGAITFDGALAPNGNYSFKDEAGAINLTLPSDSAFTLEASSDAGQVSNEFGSDTVGANPTSRVQASTAAGEIHIHKRRFKKAADLSSFFVGKE